MCYYFNDIIKIEDFNVDNILIDEKTYENILVYNISYKNIRVCNGTRYLVLFGSEKYGSIYSRIRYLIIAKSCFTYIISYNYAKLKVDSHHSLPLENSNYYNIFLAKTPYELTKI